jgi:hypothetical protein
VLNPAKHDSAWRSTVSREQEDSLGELGDFLVRQLTQLRRRALDRA